MMIKNFNKRQKEVKVIRVFVASPSDVLNEVDRVSRVVEEFNHGLAEGMGVKLELMKWDKFIAPLMGRPEEVVLKQIDLSDLDIFIGIIWLRFGTPTGGINPLLGSEFESGTEEEFLWAFKIWKETGYPKILFYRCTRPPHDLNLIDPNQLLKIKNFFDNFIHSGDHPGLIKEYQTEEDFERIIRINLHYLIRSLSNVESFKNETDLGQDLVNEGFLQLFLPSANEERNFAKSTSLKVAKHIRLIAHSGYSFLSIVGHKYRDIIEERLSNGAIFHIILINPWTITGLFIALSEKDITLDHQLKSILQQGKFPHDFDPVHFIEKSAWYSIKINATMTGYKQVKMRYPEYISLRFSKYDIPASILLSDGECFFEPYLNINLQERLKKNMLTFEIKVNNLSHLYNHAQQFYEMFWNLSEAYEDYILKEEYYKNELRKMIVKNYTI